MLMKKSEEYISKLFDKKLDEMTDEEMKAMSLIFDEHRLLMKAMEQLKEYKAFEKAVKRIMAEMRHKDEDK